MKNTVETLIRNNYDANRERLREHKAHVEQIDKQHAIALEYVEQIEQRLVELKKAANKLGFKLD